MVDPLGIVEEPTPESPTKQAGVSERAKSKKNPRSPDTSIDYSGGASTKPDKEVHMQARWLFLCLVVCTAACTGENLPVAPDAVALDVVGESSGEVQASAGASGCYTVKFNVGGNFPIFTVTGDLEGTFLPVFDLPGSLKFAGITVQNAGVAYWEISGGVIPGLEAFETTFHNKNLVIDRPGSPATLFENIGTHRAAAGVEKANLTYKGTYDDLVPGVDHNYSGVICP